MLRLFLGLLFLLTACTLTGSTIPTPTPVAVRTLQIEAPVRLKAGKPLTVLVHVTPAHATTPILLTAQGTFGFLPQQQAALDGVAQFSFMLLHTQFAGTVQLQASADGVATSAELELLPGPAVDPVLPLVGPRTIVTGGEQWTMVIATPRDALENPVAENTGVTFRAQHPTAPTEDPAVGLETIETYTRNLLAWVRIYSRNRAGAMRIAANADFAHSPERVVLETPTLPTPFQLFTDKTIVAADGRELIHLTSSQITDRFGNVLLDGTNVTVLTSSSNGERRSLPATTVDGRLYTTIQAPSQPATMTVQAWITGIASTPLQLLFTPGPAVQPILMTAKKTAEGIVVIAGPLLGALGQFIPDGAAVTFTITAPNGSVGTMVAPADYGYAQILLRRFALMDGVYGVTVAAGTGQGDATFTVVADTIVAPAVEQ